VCETGRLCLKGQRAKRRGKGKERKGEAILYLDASSQERERENSGRKLWTLGFGMYRSAYRNEIQYNEVGIASVIDLFLGNVLSCRVLKCS